MIVVGLTGSIAMGKSETAKQFAVRGIPVFDSDRAVHELYNVGGAAVDRVFRLAPEVVVGGIVDRGRLSAAIQRKPELLKVIESAVHPLIRDLQMSFLDAARREGAQLAVLDIPLLFETGRERDVDKVIVVSTTPEIQRDRALKRPGMTAEKLEFILSKQLPDAEKRARANYVIDTSISIADSQRQVDSILTELTGTPGL